MNNSKKIKQYIRNNELDLEKIINDYSSYVGTIIDNMSKCAIANEDKEEILNDSADGMPCHGNDSNDSVGSR